MHEDNKREYGQKVKKIQIIVFRIDKLYKVTLILLLSVKSLK